MAGVLGNQLPIEGESAKLRRDKIEQLRIPGVVLYLAAMASHILDLQVHLEDTFQYWVSLNCLLWCFRHACCTK